MIHPYQVVAVKTCFWSTNWSSFNISIHLYHPQIGPSCSWTARLTFPRLFWFTCIIDLGNSPCMQRIVGISELIPLILRFLYLEWARDLFNYLPLILKLVSYLSRTRITNEVSNNFSEYPYLGQSIPTIS